jgi:ribulose-phosphate 3-epimerase
MDGHFVPNLSIGPPFVKSIRKRTAAPLDVHLMVTDPAYFLERFADAGADSVTFHVEACGQGPAAVAEQAGQLIARLHELGLGAGLTLRPGTPAEALRGAVDEADLVLVMTVEPGYGGQKFMPDMLGKIAAVRGMLKRAQRLEVDGGINQRTGRSCTERGADVLVAGEVIFGAKDPAAAIRELRSAAESGLKAFRGSAAG